MGERKRSRPWKGYNAALVNEKPGVIRLLTALCAGLPTLPQTTGRPMVPLAAVIFALVMKTYLRCSSRCSMPDLVALGNEGFTGRVPHYNTMSRYLRDERLAPYLRALVEETAKPLGAIEENFAADASGFSTRRYASWEESKTNKGRMRQFVKAHVMIGTLTHVITAVEITHGAGADRKQFATLVETTAKTFHMKEVAADKGYTSFKNFEAAAAVGATPFIPFTKNMTGKGYSPLVERLYHLYKYEREKFLKRYHGRSNVESVFSAIKTKFGALLRARKPVAQANEVLLKLVAHNLTMLVQSIHELGITPVLWSEGDASHASRKPRRSA